jgi:cellulose biosynthesis protein BcsQ
MAAIARRGYTDLDRLLAAFDDQADVVLIDTQGAFTPLSHAAARASDGVVFCMEPGYYEFRALVSRLAELDRLREHERVDITPLGVLFVRCDARSRQMREYRAHLQDRETFGDEIHVFATHIRQQASVRDHPRLGRPTMLADPSGNVATDYRAFAQELLERLAAIAKREDAA